MNAPCRRGTVGTLGALACLVGGSGCGGGGGDGGAKPAAAPASVAQVEQQFVRVVREVSPSVVQIQSNGALGSGVVLDGRGNVATNAHVVGASRRFTVTLSAGNTDQAVLVGAFPAGDLAVIRLAKARPPAAEFANSSKLAVGQFALAVGNPLGLRSSVTEGIVSSLGRTVSVGNGVALPSAIQTSAPINPGNSGGALVDATGRLIGIPTLAAIDPQLGGAQAPGIGFAIPSNTVREITRQLIDQGRVVRSGRAFLGVRVATLTGGGVLVTDVDRGGPADQAGVRPGDVIASLDGQPTPSADALTAVLAARRPGQRVPVDIVRGGKRLKLTVALGELRGG